MRFNEVTDGFDTGELNDAELYDGEVIYLISLIRDDLIDSYGGMEQAREVSMKGSDDESQMELIKLLRTALNLHDKLSNIEPLEEVDG